MGRNWIVVLLMVTAVLFLTTNNIKAQDKEKLLFEIEMSIDSLDIKFNKKQKLIDYIDKINRLDSVFYGEKDYDYSLFWFSAGVALYYNDLNSLIYFKKTLDILLLDQDKFFDEKSLCYYFISKHYINDEKSFFRNIEKSFLLLAKVSENFPAQDRIMIQYLYLKSLFNQNKYEDALLKIGGIKYFDLENDWFVKFKLLEADLYTELYMPNRVLETYAIVYRKIQENQIQLTKKRVLINQYLKSLIFNKDFNLASQIIKNEYQTFSKSNNDIEKFKFYKLILNSIDSLTISKKQTNQIKSSFDKHFSNFENYAQFSFEKQIKSLKEKHRYKEAVNITLKLYEWFKLNEKPNTSIIATLLDLDKLYEKLQEYNNRTINFEKIINLLETDSSLFNKLGLLGLSVPKIASNLGNQKLVLDYLKKITDNQNLLFKRLLINENYYSDSAKAILSEIIDEFIILNKNSKELNFFDKIIIQNINLYNQKLVANKEQVKSIKELDEINLIIQNKNNFKKGILFFRTYFDKENREFRVLIYEIATNNNKFYILNKRDYLITELWKYKKMRISSITDMFNNFKKIDQLFIISSGLSSFFNYGSYSLEIEGLNEKEISIVKLNSLTEVKSYADRKIDLDKYDIALFGDIDYGSVNFKKKKESQNRKLDYTNWSYLPGTKKEIDNISSLANKFNVKPIIFSDKKASYSSIANFTNRENPYILHFASHAFFLNQKPDKSQEYAYKLWKSSDKMNRSGIILSEANKAWSSTMENSLIDDGVLTSFEIKDLNLIGCKLVVLSACDTGFGAFSYSKEIFSLQRAFKMAGADKIIMSLSKISDEKTPIFFDYFYSELFKGLTIHKAFSNTQKEMRKRYGFKDDFWASFILLE